MPPARCRICSATDLRPHFTVRQSALDRCKFCDFIQVREQPSAEELRALYADGFFKRGKYDDDFAQRKEGERRLGWLARAGLAPGARVLDAGCATGDFLALAGDRYEMWGLDVSAFATELARAKNPRCAARIFTGFVEEQRFDPASFDAIVMWDVIEHVWDPRAVLRKLLVHLRPGGALLLSTPDIGALTARLLGRRWAFMTPPEHLGFFNRRSLRFLLERELGLCIARSASRGKWANVGFLAYKLQRVFPDIIPPRVTARVQESPLSARAVYVPTADVRYTLAHKGEARACVGSSEA
jgi:2-polyprenyl-3-methyl-5-hydroxy-6-metoxy-1,4-benzoquinol methylase